ncbi:MAG: HEPN domain-containing protein [bacterium]
MEAEVYLTKAENSLKAAQLCYENGLFDDAVSRAYYSILRASIALLVNLGFVPETKRIHHWVQAVFPRECVRRRKIVPKELVAYFTELHNERDIADYQTKFLSKKSAEKSIKKSHIFISVIQKEVKK